jgi:integrase
MRLTPLTVEKIKPGAARREIADTVPGLYLVLQPSGVKSFALRYRFEGRPTKLTLGRFPALELPAARVLARAALEALDKGNDPAEEKRQSETDDATEAVAKAPGKLTRQTIVRDVWAGYLASHLEAEAGPSSVKTYKRVFKNHVAPSIGEREIGSIVKADARPIVDKALARGKAARNQTLAILSAFFNWCVDDDLLDASPVHRIKKSKTFERDRFLEDHEIKIFLLGCDLLDAEQTSAVRFGALFKVLLLTGARRCEVARMKRKEVDFTARIWTIPATRSKNRKSHRVYLADSAVRILKSLPRIKDCEYFFSANGTSPASGFNKAKTRLDERAEIAHYTLHDLRRSFTTGCGNLGISDAVADRCINHLPPKLKRTYNLAKYQKEMRAAWIIWDKHVSKLAPKSRVVVKLRPIAQRGRWARLLEPADRSPRPEPKASSKAA